MIKFHSPVIITKNVEVLKQFYINVLKQEFDLDFGACIILKCGISLWQLPSDHIVSVKTGTTYNSEGNKNMELCFETDYFDQVIIELKEYEIKILHEVIEESWGQRTIRLYDPDGNLIEIGETIPSFIRRLYLSGMSVSDISQKSSVPEVLVKEYTKE